MAPSRAAEVVGITPHEATAVAYKGPAATAAATTHGPSAARNTDLARNKNRPAIGQRVQEGLDKGQ